MGSKVAPVSLTGALMTVRIADAALFHPYPPSWYAATARIGPPRPTLEGIKQVDVCVIGGGYTGLSAALHCAERGLSVVLLEGKRIGWGASGLNGGQVLPGWNRTLRGLVQQFGTGRAQALFSLAQEAVEGLFQRIEQHRIACDARRGHLIVAVTPGDMGMLETEVANRKAMDYPYSRLVDRETASHLSGMPGVHGGLLDTRGGHVHPLNLALGLAQAAELAGARLHEDSKVLRLRQAGARVQVDTARGKVLARHVVVACGEKSGKLLEPVRRRTSALTAFAAATAPLGAAEVAGLVKDGLAVCDTRMAVNYFHLSPDNRLLFGGGERYRLRPDETAEMVVRPRLEAVLPQLAGVPLDYTWSGTVTITSSRMPAVGRTGLVYFADGYSGQGVALSHLVGKVLAEAICGDTRRFDLLSQLPNLAVPGGCWLRMPIFAAIGAIAAFREAH